MGRRRTIGFGRRWFAVLAVYAPVCLAAVNTPQRGLVARWDGERAVWRAPFHHTAAGAILRRGATDRCGALHPAEALATPDPVLDRVEARSKVAVSFVIGTDGRVHSPVVIESGGSDEDSTVLEAVRGWRYRPATCNAVPAETESKVEFSSR